MHLSQLGTEPKGYEVAANKSHPKEGDKLN